jgi:hypothetical protein
LTPTKVENVPALHRTQDALDVAVVPITVDQVPALQEKQVLEEEAPRIELYVAWLQEEHE